MATILYVDDEEINLKLFAINFGKKNQIFTAISGEQGLQILRENNDISIVFTDMKMPIMNGLEFIHIAKPLCPAIPFYLMTGYGLTEEVQQAIDAGEVKNYLKKPFDLNELLSAIAGTEAQN